MSLTVIATVFLEPFVRATCTMQKETESFRLRLTESPAAVQTVVTDNYYVTA